MPLGAFKHRLWRITRFTEVLAAMRLVNDVILDIIIHSACRIEFAGESLSKKKISLNYSNIKYFFLVVLIIY
jgi:hypothetical protein